MLYLCHTEVQVGQNYSSLGQFSDYRIGWNWQIMLWFPVSLRDSSILPSIQTNSRANPPSFLFSGFWRLFVGDTVGMAWRWPFTSILCRGYDAWRYTTMPPCLHSAVLHKGHRQLQPFSSSVSVIYTYIYTFSVCLHCFL